MAWGSAVALLHSSRMLPQAQNDHDLDLNPASPVFANEILDSMRRADQLHFNLTGMRRLNSPDGVLLGPSEYNQLGSAKWELRTIWEDPTLKAKTDFYPDGLSMTPDGVLTLP